VYRRELQYGETAYIFTCIVKLDVKQWKRAFWDDDEICLLIAHVHICRLHC